MEGIDWTVEGRTLPLGVTRAGEGERLLLLPALSSVSTRDEWRGLQDALAGRFETIAVDWPGFGTAPRPAIPWKPRHLRAFLAALPDRLGPFSATLAAGHAAAYAIAQAAEVPGSLGRLVLASPTWRGPLPTMAGRRARWMAALARAADRPVLGPLLYRLNVNGPVLAMMLRGHVYQSRGWLTAGRMAAKRRVTEAPGARHGALRFVTGGLDLYPDRAALLADAARLRDPVTLLQPARGPRRSGAEMQALAALDSVQAILMRRGKLSFYEEFPEDMASVLLALESPEGASAAQALTN